MFNSKISYFYLTFLQNITVDVICIVQKCNSTITDYSRCCCQCLISQGVRKKTAQNMWYHLSLTLCGDRHAHQAWRKQAYEERASSQKQAKEGMWMSCCRLTIEVQWNAEAQTKTYFSRLAVLDPSKCFASVTPWYAQHKRSVGKTGLQKNRSYINASLCGRTNFFTRI